MKKLLIGIFLLGLLIRTVSLQSHPVGFTPDEASFGYDAYAILNTGTDQWGNFLPLNLKSFGDFKLPILTYIMIPFVFLLDLSVYSVRLPNALFGSFAIIAVYLFTDSLLKNKRVALFSALFLAISPWHIALSRGAFEANLTTFLLPLGLYLFFRGRSNPRYMFAAAIILGLNMFTYHTARILTLPVALLAVVMFFKVKSNLKIFFTILAIFSIVTAFAMFNGGTERLSSSSIISEASNVYDQRFSQILIGEPEFLNKLFNNKFTYIFERFSHNYLSYLSPQFLFTEGAREYTYGMNTSVGVLYFFEIFTLLFAVSFFIKKPSKNLLFIVLILLMSPIPAALSVGPGHAANRAAFMMPAITILSAFGFIRLFDLIQNLLSKKFAFVLFGIILALSFSGRFEGYWYGQRVRGAQAMFYGAEELVDYVSAIDDQYDHVVVTNNLSEPHIYFAFFNKIDPKIYAENTTNWPIPEKYSWVDQQPVYQLENITFRDIDWQRERSLKNALLVGRKNDFPEDINNLHVIYYENGEIAFRIVETRTNAFVYAK